MCPHWRNARLVRSCRPPARHSFGPTAQALADKPPLAPKSEAVQVMAWSPDRAIGMTEGLKSDPTTNTVET